MISGILTLRISPGTMRTLSYPLSVSASTAGSFLSSSTAVTSAPASARPCVSVPIPGPISNTRSPGSIWAASTMPCTMPASIRKFCPSFLLMRRPKAFNIWVVTSRLAILGWVAFSLMLVPPRLRPPQQPQILHGLHRNDSGVLKMSWHWQSPDRA